MKKSQPERLAILEVDIQYIKEHVRDNKERSVKIKDKVDLVQLEIHEIKTDIKGLRQDHTLVKTNSFAGMISGLFIIVKVYFQGRFGL